MPKKDIPVINGLDNLVSNPPRPILYRLIVKRGVGMTTDASYSPRTSQEIAWLLDSLVLFAGDRIEIEVIR